MNDNEMNFTPNDKGEGLAEKGAKRYSRTDIAQEMTVELEKAKTVDFKSASGTKKQKSPRNAGKRHPQSNKGKPVKKGTPQNKKRLSPSRDGLSQAQRDIANGMTRVISRVSESVSSTSEKTRKKHVETLSKRIRKYKEKQKRKNRRFLLRMQRTAVGGFIFRIFKEPLASKKTEKTKLELFFDKVERYLTTCKLARFIAKMRERICFCEAKNYGILLFTSGSCFALGFSGASFLSLPYNSELSTMILGLVLIALSIPLLLSKNTISYVFENSAICDFLFYSFLGARRQNLDKSVKVSWIFFLLAGLFIGALGFLVSPYIILAILLIALLVGFTFASPEFGLTLTVCALPFLSLFERPTVMVCISLIICSVSYLRKLLLNKRSFRFTPCDLFVLIFMLFYLFGGLFSASPESKGSAIVYFIVMAVYFLASNLLSNKRVVGNMVGVILFSGFLIAVFGIFQQLSGEMVANWLDPRAFDYITGRISSTFDNPNVFASYIIMILPFAFVNARERFTPFLLFSRALIIVVLGASLVFTWSRGAWLGAIVSILALAIFSLRKSPRILVALFAFIPNVILLLPRAITQRFSSIFSFLDTNVDSSVSYRFTVWKDSLSLLKDNLFGGVGVGSEAYKEAMLHYGSIGVEAAEHSHNLYLQIGVELGIFALLTFCLILIFTLRNCYSVEFSANETGARHICTASLCSCIALLTNGLFDHVWYNYRVCLFFWLALGLCSASYRTGISEQRQIDYQASRISNIANVDIPIKK
ncbi:MAG: O-antigen ligase family protein [Clostridia bacterium]|nr:O-antigen ligase family protein [Clostridia bacterium]